MVNEPMAQVLNRNYSQCLVTADQKYLIPNDVTIETLKTSSRNQYSELIYHISNYTSVTSRSINAGVNFPLSLFGISGSFAYDHSKVKETLSRDRSTLSRMEMRVRQYDVRSATDSRLDPVFEDRVLDIASAIQANDNATASYMAEKLVRDYGTHFVKAVEVGAIVIQEDHLMESYIKSMETESKTVSLAAGLSECIFILMISLIIFVLGHR